MFSGRKLLIAAMHEKEKTIAPLLEKELGVQCFVAENLDTDILGTFTGEVERKDDPVTTARNKCLMVMELNDCNLAVASEGSFGPHPLIFFAHSDDEMLLFIDKKNDLEIIVRELTTETNFNGDEIKSEKELKEFVKKVKFPTHGLIVRKEKEDFTEIIKGITDWEKLNITFHHFIKKYGVAYIETDMRAMYNPIRMQAIERATKKLVDKINSCCPQCNTPGFGVTDGKRRLPCSL